MPIESRLLRRLTDGVRDLLFPPRCLGCDTLLPPLPDGDSVLCPLCRTAWETARAEAAPVADEAIRNGHAFAVLYHSGRTDGVPERVIYHVKHLGSPRAFAFVAAALEPRVRALLAQPPGQVSDPAAAPPADLSPDRPFEPSDKRSAELFVASTPAHALAATEDARPPLFTYPPRRRRAINEDGFDQAACLAKALANACGGTFAPLLRRTHRSTAEQKRLSADARMANAAVSYALGRNAADRIRGRTVILCDDLATTGATLDACAALLLQAGAARVLWVTIGQTHAHPPS